MIEIQNIINLKETDIIDLLLDEKEQPFEIYVPKSTKLFFSESSEIANDYAMLAFAGQKLNEASEEFNYWYVSPANHDSVLFEVKTKNIESLAKTRLYLSYGYNNQSEENTLYFDKVFDFIEKVRLEEISPVCPDFIEDCKEYSEESLRDNSIE